MDMKEIALAHALGSMAGVCEYQLPIHEILEVRLVSHALGECKHREIVAVTVVIQVARLHLPVGVSGHHG